MNMNKMLAATVLGTITTLGISSAQATDDCHTILQDYYNWASEIGSSQHVVGVTMSTNLDTRKFVSYSVGELNYYPSKFKKVGGIFVIVPERLQGDAEQTFSDRVWNEPPPPGGFFGVQHPFSPYAKDKLGIDIHVNPGDATKAQVTFTLKSWGNGKVSIDAECANGHIYGFDKGSQHGRGMYDLTLTKDAYPIIK